jgi:hypothetical protein
MIYRRYKPTVNIGSSFNAKVVSAAGCGLRVAASGRLAFSCLC